jgi:hypothetical protein
MNDKSTLKIVDYIENDPPIRLTFIHHAIGVYAHFIEGVEGVRPYICPFLGMRMEPGRSGRGFRRR